MNEEFYTVKIIGLLDERIKEYGRLTRKSKTKVLADFLRESIEITEYFRDSLREDLA